MGDWWRLQRHTDRPTANIVTDGHHSGRPLYRWSRPDGPSVGPTWRPVGSARVYGQSYLQILDLLKDTFHSCTFPALKCDPAGRTHPKSQKNPSCGGDVLRLWRKAGVVRVWVAGKTVWSHCYTGAESAQIYGSERFRDEGLIIKRYKNSSVYFTLLVLSACLKIPKRP